MLTANSGVRPFRLSALVAASALAGQVLGRGRPDLGPAQGCIEPPMSECVNEPGVNGQSRTVDRESVRRFAVTSVPTASIIPSRTTTAAFSSTLPRLGDDPGPLMRTPSAGVRAVGRGSTPERASRRHPAAPALGGRVRLAQPDLCQGQDADNGPKLEARRRESQSWNIPGRLTDDDGVHTDYGAAETNATTANTFRGSRC